MKKLLTLALVLFSLVSFSQSVELIQDELGYVHYKKYYDSTRDVMEKGQYLNGKRVGTWYQYYKTGEIQTVAYFSSDKREGKWKFYNLYNDMVIYAYYDEGRLTRTVEIRNHE